MLPVSACACTHMRTYIQSLRQNSHRIFVLFVTQEQYPAMVPYAMFVAAVTAASTARQVIRSQERSSD